MFFDRIHPLAFILAFGFGLFMCYLTKPQSQVVVKFPSPNNANQVTYTDQSSNCFKIKADQVECPYDKSLIKPQPIT